VPENPVCRLIIIVIVSGPDSVPVAVDVSVSAHLVRRLIIIVSVILSGSVSVHLVHRLIIIVTVSVLGPVPMPVIVS
jgi:hypothetical protein